MTGDQLIGIAAVITAVGALITTLTNRGKASRTVNIAERIDEAMGHPTGDDQETVLQILREVRDMTMFLHEQSTYQHTRNHDILAALHRISNAIPTLVALLEDLHVFLQAQKENP